MAGFVGWLGAPVRAGAADAGIASAWDADPEAGTPDGLQVAVQGEIRWKDAGLAALARERGEPAALAEAYRRAGTSLDRWLGGHFALALADSARRIVILATDRMGTRPLCYARTPDGGLVFGSTAECVRRHPAVTARPSAQAIYDYIYFHMIPSPATVYAGIMKLERASTLVCENRTLATRSWWTPVFAEHADTPKEELARELRATLRDAVRRCRPAEDTASFLSGGLDSSTVCGVHRELAGRVTPAYTIGFGAEGYDEMHYARIAARRFGLDLREHYVTADDIVASMRDIARAYDEPFGNSSTVPTLACARRAYADGVRTMLAGDGGDEIFAGNERYARQTVFEYYRRCPAWLRRALVEPLILNANRQRRREQRHLGRLLTLPRRHVHRAVQQRDAAHTRPHVELAAVQPFRTPGLIAEQVIRTILGGDAIEQAVEIVGVDERATTCRGRDVAQRAELVERRRRWPRAPGCVRRDQAARIDGVNGDVGRSRHVEYTHERRVIATARTIGDERVHIAVFDVATATEPEDRLATGCDRTEPFDRVQEHLEALFRRVLGRRGIEARRVRFLDFGARRFEPQAAIAAPDRFGSRLHGEPAIRREEESRVGRRPDNGDVVLRLERRLQKPAHHSTHVSDVGDLDADLVDHDGKQRTRFALV